VSATRNAPEQKFQIQVANILRHRHARGLSLHGLSVRWRRQGARWHFESDGGLKPAGAISRACSHLARALVDRTEYDAGRPSGDQLERQTEIRAIGGIYEFAWTIEKSWRSCAGWRAAPASLAEPRLADHTGWHAIVSRSRVSKRVRRRGRRCSAALNPHSLLCIDMREWRA